MSWDFRANSLSKRLLQYSGWEKKDKDDIYTNQKQLSDVVADYFFVCPTNLFANIVSSRGARVYYYFFTHVMFCYYSVNYLFGYCVLYLKDTEFRARRVKTKQAVKFNI